MLWAIRVLNDRLRMVCHGEVYAIISVLVLWQRTAAIKSGRLDERRSVCTELLWPLSLSQRKSLIEMIHHHYWWLWCGGAAAWASSSSYMSIVLCTATHGIYFLLRIAALFFAHTHSRTQFLIFFGIICGMDGIPAIFRCCCCSCKNIMYRYFILGTLKGSVASHSAVLFWEIMELICEKWTAEQFIKI